MKAHFAIGAWVLLLLITQSAHAQIIGLPEEPPAAPPPSTTLNPFDPNPTTSATINGTGSIQAELGMGLTITNGEYRVLNSSGSVVIDWTNTTADNGAFDSELEPFSFSFILPAPGTYTVYTRATQTDGYGDTLTAEATQEITYTIPDPTPSPTPAITPTPTPSPEPEPSSSGSDQGPGGDCCAHDDDKVSKAPTPRGKVLGTSTTPLKTTYECSVLPKLSGAFLSIFNLELNFPESDYWSFRVKAGAWKDIPSVLNSMLWHQKNQDTYDPNFNWDNDSINFRCVDKKLISDIRWVFRVAYERDPNTSEYGYWYRRLMRIEKISVPDLYGAMQWQKLHDKDHSNDINIVRNFKTMFGQ